MRIFIAIDFNDLKDYFIRLQNIFPKNAKLILAKSFHVTLKFLGDVQPNNADKIIDILKKIKFDGFYVSLDSIGFFPTENYIRVVWLGVKPDDKILNLQNEIDELLKGMFKKERDFKAHITLARVKYLEDKNGFVEQMKKIKIEKKIIKIKDFRLMKSILTPKGPIYEDLAILNFSK